MPADFPYGPSARVVSATWDEAFGVIHVVYDRNVDSGYEQDPPFLTASQWTPHGAAGVHILGASYVGLTGIDIQTDWASGPHPTSLSYVPNFGLPPGDWTYTWAGTDPWPLGPFLGAVQPYTVAVV